MHTGYQSVFIILFYAGSDILSTLAVAIATYQSLYPVVLIFPFLLMSHKVSSPKLVASHQCSFLCAWM